MNGSVEDRAGAPKRLRAHGENFVIGARNALWAVLLVILVYYTMFRLPFRFPPRLRLWSASYAFGFNNGIAILALAGLLGAVVLFYFLRPRKGCESRIDFPSARMVTGQHSTSVMLALLGLLYVGLTFAMYSYSVYSAPWLMWETRHFLYRTWLMDVYRLCPYTDFQAEYGPILAYAPLYLYWLLKPLGASHEQAYFASHLFLNLCGLWCAYYLLSRAIMPTVARLVAFALLAIAGFTPYMGLNGVLLRYLCPFACLLLGHRVIVWTLSHARRASGSIAAVVAALLLLAANILLSPEAAVAFAVAWLGYGLLMFRREPRILVVSSVAFTVAGLLCWLLLPPAYYGSLLRFSEGANNLPLLPAPHLLFYLLTMFLVVPPLLAASMREPTNGNIPGAALSSALGLLCVAMAPGALGRCDPPHVLFYGMGASLLLMIRLSNNSRTAFAIYAATYAVVFIILMHVVNLQVFYGVSPQALLSRRGVADVIWKLHNAAGTERPGSAILSALDQYPRLGLPFATFGDPAVERYVLSRGQLNPDYYVSIVGVYTPAALERKLRDVAKMEYLLVPQGFGSGVSPDPCSEYLKSLQQWFLYPAKLPCRADPLDPSGTVNSFISDHYIPVEHVGSWLVLRRTLTPANQ